MLVSGGVGGKRRLLRGGLRQGAASRSQKRLVPVRLARERQLLHPLKVDFEEDGDNETQDEYRLRAQRLGEATVRHAARS